MHILLYIYRNLEDFVTWTDTSAIRKHVLEYNEMVCTYILYFKILIQFIIVLVAFKASFCLLHDFCEIFK